MKKYYFLTLLIFCGCNRTPDIDVLVRQSEDPSKNCTLEYSSKKQSLSDVIFNYPQAEGTFHGLQKTKTPGVIIQVFSQSQELINRDTAKVTYERDISIGNGKFSVCITDDNFYNQQNWENRKLIFFRMDQENDLQYNSIFEIEEETYPGSNSIFISKGFSSPRIEDSILPLFYIVASQSSENQIENGDTIAISNVDELLKIYPEAFIIVGSFKIK